jgi:hypothetical protein
LYGLPQSKNQASPFHGARVAHGGV